MSYSKFLDAVGKHIKWRKENNLPDQNYERDFDEVRDKWINKKRYQELISFILENWDSGNCDDFIKPLIKILVQEKEISLYKRLWKGIIRHRAEKFWNYADTSLSPTLLDKVNVSDFNMFKTESYNSPERVTAFHRQFCLNAIDIFIEGLKTLNSLDDVDKLTTYRNNIYNIQRPKIKATTDKRKIDEELFWELIENNRAISDDQFEFLEKLKQSLEAFHPTEIRKFQKILLTKISELDSWDIWALAYIVRKGCGDDAFDYFKAWVVSKGQIAFNNIVKMNNDKIDKLFNEEPQLEELFYLAENVYEDKTGDLMKPVQIKKQKIKGKQWDENALTSLYPDLCELFEFKNNSR
jgi:hypothetical protein